MRTATCMMRRSAGNQAHCHTLASELRDLLGGRGLEVPSIWNNQRTNDIPNTALGRFSQRHVVHFDEWAWMQEFLDYQFVLVGTKN